MNVESTVRVVKIWYWHAAYPPAEALVGNKSKKEYEKLDSSFQIGIT